MKKTYAYIPEAGWLASSHIKLEDLSDKIISFAAIHPTGYKGKTENSDNIGLVFNGVTIRLLKSVGLGARGYEIRVEILGDVKRIWQGFIDLWMYLSDNGYVLGEPSNRIDIQEDEEQESKPWLNLQGKYIKYSEGIRLWCSLYYSCPEIEKSTGIWHRTMNQIIYELRRDFKELGIPSDKERKEKLRETRIKKL